MLNHYIENGIVDLSKTSLPGKLAKNESQTYRFIKKSLRKQRLFTVIQLNDCLYRNIHRYKYIAYIDIDEVIVPREFGHTWFDLINSLSKRYNESAYYWFKSTYFFDDGASLFSNDSVHQIPNSMHILSHKYRSKDHFKGKSLINTQYIKVTYHIAHSILDL